ncbi:Threonine/homoserine efflux transporter RhtA [Desulfomicrobium norvegicum]|uniref:Threonine/homoserine efflux transporter RhtA n=1 Tax=Desulfomicrobium norvegicum (strain DSM 1741 / NCIMB 8310) TaxID=52561 RepID=A0A8G2C3J5_DESNO|nr:DMT family transporter [Desulfomicrobium norvegicum]SFL72118.1 Threonine/homoserine efflux transporter RhtA [Desulfomicrobium norvegicum]
MKSESLSMTAVSPIALLPRLAVLGAVVLWGASFSTMRIALQDLHPMSVMWLRMIIALACILPLYRTVSLSAYRKGDWKLLVAAVVFQPCLYFWLESAALGLTSSAQAGIISASVPLLVAVAAWMILKEPLSTRVVGGLLLSVAGVAVLTLGGQATVSAPSPLLGNSMEFLAMVCAAANMIIIRILGRRYDAWTLTVMQVVTGCLFFSPGIVHLMDVPAGTFDMQLVLILVFLGAGVTLGAFSLYNWAITRMPASTASAHINLIPVVAVGCGFAFLGETMNPLQMAAACVVLCSVLMTQKS